MASILTLILFFCASSSISNASQQQQPTKFTLTLTPTNRGSDPIQALNSLAASTIARAKHLKTPRPRADGNGSSSTPLYPKSYGGYSISLSFGTPPQKSGFVFDTGSSLVWFPCTSRYLCSRCTFPGVDPAAIPKFIPKLSSSARLIGCRNPKCAWVAGPDPKCSGPSNDSCPAYVIQYGSGSTAGLLLSDNLDLPGGGAPFPGFLVGCSILSIRQPAGIAGFGRGPESLPSQLGLSKFSYCLVSHRLDDSPLGSDLVLYRGDEGRGGGNISYTPFQKNPGDARSAFLEYYYVLLRRVIVGGRRVKIPYAHLVPGSDGNGGTIVDSGSTFTFMEKAVHEAVAGEVGRQMGRYRRARDVENRTGLAPCFDVSEEKSVVFPELAFQFKGGAKMELPLPNYFSLLADGVVCLTVVTSGGAGPELVGGPAIILGNYQHMNFHVEYDLKNQRFGFRRQTCSTK